MATTCAYLLMDRLDSRVEQTKHADRACSDPQTGSGKTWTMTGSPHDPGLTPRSITELFAAAQERSRTSDINVSSYFVELYNENLVDLFFKMDKWVEAASWAMLTLSQHCCAAHEEKPRSLK
jgi:hypothetical protein